MLLGISANSMSSGLLNTGSTTSICNLNPVSTGYLRSLTLISDSHFLPRVINVASPELSSCPICLLSYSIVT